MKNILYGSLEEMIRPETLSGLVNRRMTRIQLRPYQTAGWSSTESQFLAIKIDGEKNPQYILKKLARDQDWVMQTTDDRHWRTVSIWQNGLLDSLPEEIDHAIIACAMFALVCGSSVATVGSSTSAAMRSRRCIAASRAWGSSSSSGSSPAG